MKIYIVTLRWIDSPINPEMIDAILAQRGDWLRWNGWTWLLASNSAPSEIRGSLMQRLSANDNIIIAEVSSTSVDGWAPKWVWDWIIDRSRSDYRAPVPLPPPPPPPQGFFAQLYDPKK